MIRIIHTACIAVLVTVALIAYGVTEETRALQKRITELKTERQRAYDQFATAEAEWDHLNNPDHLTRIAARVYGAGGLRAPDGAPMARLAAGRVIDLSAETPFLEERGLNRLPTADIPAKSTPTDVAAREGAPQ